LDGAQGGGEVEAAEHVGDVAGAERGGVGDGDDGGVEHGEAEDAGYLFAGGGAVSLRVWLCFERGCEGGCEGGVSDGEGRGVYVCVCLCGERRR
jgi:hypothetical protein